MSTRDYRTLDFDLQGLLGLAVPPIAVSLVNHVPANIAPFGGERPALTSDVAAARCRPVVCFESRLASGRS